MPIDRWGQPDAAGQSADEPIAQAAQPLEVALGLVGRVVQAGHAHQAFDANVGELGQSLDERLDLGRLKTPFAGVARDVHFQQRRHLAAGRGGFFFERGEQPQTIDRMEQSDGRQTCGGACCAACGR